MSDSDNNTGQQYVFQKAVRAPFLNVVEAVKVGEKGKGKGDPVFSATVLIPPDSPDLAAIKAAVAEVARATWPGRDFAADIADAKFRVPFSSGDKDAAKAEAKGRDGSFFKGMVVLKARADELHPPVLAKIANKQVVTLEGAQREIEGKKVFYNGCMVLPCIFLAAYKSEAEGGIGAYSGVKAYLSQILFAGDGERIGGQSASETFRAYAGTVTNENPFDKNEMDDDIPF